METITTLVHNPTLTSLVNMPVFGAILLALIVYRIVSPIIDFLNPLIILTNVGWSLRHAIFGAVCRAAKAFRRKGVEPTPPVEIVLGLF